MRPSVPTRHGIVALALLAPAPPVAGQAFTTAVVDCKGLQLQAAAGVPGNPVHTYEFVGDCRLLVGDGKNPPKLVWTFPVKAAARWDGGKHELKEWFQILGGFEWNGAVIGGQLKSTFTCSGDPIVWPAVGITPVCNGIAYDNGTNLKPLDAYYAKHHPVTFRRASLDLATKLSANAPPPSGNGDVPPPPAPKPNSTPRLPVIPVPTNDPPLPPHPVTRGVPPRDNTGRIVAAPPPTFPAPGPLPLRAGAALPLADGNALAARSMNGALRWVITDPRGRVLRVFPSGATAATDAQGKVTVSLGRQVTEVGTLRTEGP